VPRPSAKTRPTLTRDRVVRAAVTLADQDGLDGLTMRRLGEAVGVEAMSLYHHVASKEDLLDGMVDLIFSEIDLSVADDGDWRRAMRQRAISARDVLARHGWAIGLMDSRSSPGPATMTHFDDALRCLRGAGFSVEMTVHAYGVIYSYVYGFVIQTLSRDLRTHQAQQILELTGSDRYPSAREITEYLLRAGDEDTPNFERGLDLILGGLERVLGTGGEGSD
jgi:AcrR family transcriptional regulator